jgi:hypothetical protein
MLAPAGRGAAALSHRRHSSCTTRGARGYLVEGGHQCKRAEKLFITYYQLIGKFIINRPNLANSILSADPASSEAKPVQKGEKNKPKSSNHHRR